MNDDFTLTLRNKQIYDFYHNHNLNFEQMNILLFNMLQQIMHNNDQAFHHTIAQALLDKLTNMEQTIQLQQQDTLHKIQQAHHTYTLQLQQLLLANHTEHITPLIKETNNMLIERTTNIMREIIPHTNSQLSHHMEQQFQILQTQLNHQTEQLISKHINQQNIDDFIQQSNTSLSHTIQTLTTLLATTEQRIDQKLNNTHKSIQDVQQTVQHQHFETDKLQKSVYDMLKKFEKGSGKGNVSENVVYNILLSLFPCAQIDYVGNEMKETGDIVLIRTNKPKILIENKDHDTCNVPKADIDKFIRDCEIQQCCGIMLSQNRGIANKDNFELQIHNGNVLLYVHNVHFDTDKIKTAIEIVEQFKLKFDELNLHQHSLTIDASILEEINKEFNKYTTQKHSLLKLVKDFSDKINSSILELKMPNLEQFLSKHYATSAKQTDNICKYCERFIPKSMSQHYRYCTEKKRIDDMLINSTEC